MKLCNCKKQFIDDLLDDFVNDSKRCADSLCSKRLLVIDYVQEIARIVEKECVCSKEENKRTPSDKCLHGYDLTESCKHCDWDNKYGKGEERHLSMQELIMAKLPQLEQEKQSQSPCEHPKDMLEEFEFQVKKPNFINNSGENNDLHWMYSHKSLVRMYACKVCGLVTCKNPNRE